ncbi:Hepatocellular carcinoma-associated antigen 59 [Penicillium bovifimosum]|uniref:Hepatocellular carcinoma-associated antigen 59 n=1 Tax=Penicillium bovifimosum TaxID=126998 RepID=A0A9W9H714_9EURO|nr:Hepatocellular carcinoma-associated antigen 59 [Penicillium bovifimosum]KAJ5138876.1 Hepatocellular carcinoma-associated antigen 59 [Penicillium bovifimosum]
MSQGTMDTEPNAVPTEPLFRPAKKRKFLRRRPDDETENTDNQNADSDTPQASGSNNPRRPRPVRKGGIGFTTTSRLGDTQGQQVALVPAGGDPDDEKIRAMNERFTGYTGQSVDVDRHMYEPFPAADRPADISNSNNPTQEEAAAGAGLPGHQKREPATLGKLHEIDLGHEATLRNIARTEAATRKMAEKGDLPTSAPDATSEAGGKSWRNRKQRTQADIDRDRLVEEVLRESKLDIYDEQDEEAQLDDQQAADDRVAEQFRRDFMDAMQSRRRIRPAAKPATAAEGPRGPKLGGSRSARAAMRERETQAAKK